ncbi:MAG: hypothetical protein WDN06_07605 [Asticcacaulis sp.]
MMQDMQGVSGSGGGWSFAKLTIVNASLREWAGRLEKVPAAAQNS